MPKMKNKRAAVKRFKQTAGGIKRGQSHRRHILTKKSTKRKRHLRADAFVNKCDVGLVKQMIKMPL